MKIARGAMGTIGTLPRLTAKGIDHERSERRRRDPDRVTMSRPTLGAAALRDELNQAALALSLDSEGAKIDFMLPTLAEAGVDRAEHNWDVQAYCPEELDAIARRAVERVAAIWDLDPHAIEDEGAIELDH